MKNKIFSLIITIIAITALWFFSHKPQIIVSQRQDTLTNAPAAATTPIQAPAINSVMQVTNNDPTETNTIADVAAKYNQGLIGKEQAMQAVILEENKKSLDMYGKVVDQYGNFVSGAKVRGGIGLNISMVKSGGEFRYTETDSQGLFNFLGIHGAGIGIWLQKEGYFYNQKSLPGRPENYSPDPNNPLVFTMWKIHGAEVLTGSDIDVKIPHDGTPTTFDITTGKVSPNGDFRVTLSQYPLEIKHGWDRFDWSVKVEILNGGMMEENDPYPYWAPTNGYQASFEFNESSNAVKWLGGLQQKIFYIKTAQGQYGLMNLKVFPGRSPTGIEANFTVNPSGSQNLEPDFSKQ
jgi:hypothetical protein